MISRRNRLISVALGAGLVVLGVKGAIWVAGDTLLALDSKDWITAQATVENSHLEQSFGARGVGAEYSPRVRFRFKVRDREYHGNRFEIPARRSSSEDYERSRLAPYFPGAHIEILHDPSDPTRSVINRPRTNYWFTLGLGAFSLAILLAGMWLSGAILVDIARRPNNRLQRSGEG